MSSGGRLESERYARGRIILEISMGKEAGRQSEEAAGRVAGEEAETGDALAEATLRRIHGTTS